MEVSEVLQKNWKPTRLRLLVGLPRKAAPLALMPGENQKRDEVRQLEEKIEALLKDLHSTEKERDALKAQVEILKEIIRPAQPTLNEEPKEKSA